MKQRSATVAAAVMVGMLYGCGGGGNGAPDPTPIDPMPGILQAQVDNPDLATQLVPTFHINALSKGAAVIRSAADATARSQAFAATESTLTTVAELETDYETNFCQLNAEHGVTMQSPQCQANIAWIKQQSGTGQFDLNAKPILNNPLGVTGVLFQTVNYSTTVTLPQGQKTFAVSGGLMLPQGIPAAKVKGIVTYFHGTTFNKAMVGSNYATNGETRLAAQVFASQGYIVVIPDYVGQGVNWADVHPYVLYPRVTAKTAVDMLAAVAPTIRAQYQLDPAARLKLFSAGYSEGGAYSLWLTSFLNEQPATLDPLYQLKHSIGIEGAYNTSTVTKGFLFDNVSQVGDNTYRIQTQVVTNLVKPLLGADALLSYASYQLGGATGSVFNSDFYGLNCAWPLPQAACNVNDQHVDMATAFAQPDFSAATPILLSALRKSANGATYPGVVDLLISTSNSANSLVSPTLLSASGQAQLDAALRAADVNLAALPDGAVSIVSLDQDSVVTPKNYATLLAAYPGKFRVSVVIPAASIQVVSPFSYYVQKNPAYVNVDHMQAPVYTFLYALNTFNQF